ncbi:MAG: sigma-70 family RNA polymerase sigma factor [Clostridia bacterium]|nr:sigma-70 family RNA polymerase sigma factor [Clostridia bacterium]
MTNNSFDLVYQKYYVQLVRYCFYRVGKKFDLAEDIVNEAFILLYQKWDQLDFDCDTKILSWLTKAILNKIYEYRRKNPLPLISLDEEVKKEYIESQAIQSIDTEDEEFKYRLYLESIEKFLPSDECKLFYYIVIQEYDYKKCASLLGITENAVKLRWYRIKRKLRPFVETLIKD